MAALKAVWSKIAEMGIEVFGIMGHQIDATDFLWRVEPPFLMLIDQDQRVIGKYGVTHPRLGGLYTMARPATYVVDADGIVRYAYVGESKADRPDVSTLLKTLHEVVQDARKPGSTGREI